MSGTCRSFRPTREGRDPVAGDGAPGSPPAEAEGGRSAEAEVGWMGFKASIEVHFISAPRPPTHLGAQLGDGPHSPVGWRADRSTAGLYGSQDAKSSRTKPPGTGPRGRQPARHPPLKGPQTLRARNAGRRTSPRWGRAGSRPAATGPPPPATDQQLTTVNRR